MPLPSGLGQDLVPRVRAPVTLLDTGGLWCVCEDTFTPCSMVFGIDFQG